METKVYTPRQAWELLGIGRTKFYQLLQEKKIKFFRNGKRYLIPESALVEFVEEQTTQYSEGGGINDQ